MSLEVSTELSTTAFEKTRLILNNFDNSLTPFCKVEGLAIAPRVVQIALNSFALADALVSSLVLSLLCVTPLHGKVQGWRDDALTLTAELANKIALLIIAVIPYFGSKMLSRLQESEASEKRLCGEIKGLKQTVSSHDRTIARYNQEKETLKESLQSEISAKQQGQMKSYVDEIGKLTAEKEGLRSELTSQYEEKFKTLGRNYGEQNESLKKAYDADIKKVRETFAHEKEGLQLQCKKQEEGLHSALEDVKKCVNQNARLKEEYEGQFATLNALAENLKLEKAKIGEELVTVRKERDDVQTAYETLQAAKKEAETRASTAEAQAREQASSEIAHLKKAIGELEAKNKASEKLCETFKRDLNITRGNTKILEDRIIEMKREFSQREKEHKSSHERSKRT